MYVTILEYALIRLGLGAVQLVLHAVRLLFLAGLWVLGMLVRLAFRPLMRELARALGRLRGHLRLAARSRFGVGPVTSASRR